MSLRLNQICAIFALLAAALCCAVTIKRGYRVYQAAHIPPGVVVTSGCEEESLFSIWRVVQNEELYQSALKIPYASAYFNWLFYFGYGAISAPFAHGLGDHIIPVTGRLFTFIGASIGSLALIYFAFHLRKKETPSIRYATGAFSTIVFMGPLTGWWVHTVRPDVWALAFECIGLIWLLLKYRSNRRISILGAGICFYIAWAFKHSYIQGLLVATIFLIFEHQWRWVIRLLLGLILAWLITLIAGGGTYRSWLIQDVGNSYYSLALGFQNWHSALLKMAPLLIVGVAATRFGINTPLAQITRRLTFCSLPVVFFFSFLTSSKMGAADNYYFSASLLVALVALTIDFGKVTACFWIPACGLSSAFSVFLLFHPTPLQTEILQARWAVWNNAEEPRFSEDTRLNLPWLNPMSPPFVLAYHYYSNRNKNRPFERNGIGGLISTEYFSSLLLFNNLNNSYDGVPLTNYEQITTIEGMTLYKRKDQRQSNQTEQNSPAKTN